MKDVYTISGLIQTIDGLQGPPYSYYGGSAFEPKEYPPVGAMWLPGHRLATKVPGDEGSVFHANGPFQWRETSGMDRIYPDPANLMPILAQEPTGWDIRTGMRPRGHFYRGDVGPSVAGFGGLGQEGPNPYLLAPRPTPWLPIVGSLAAAAFVGWMFYSVTKKG